MFIAITFALGFVFLYRGLLTGSEVFTHDALNSIGSFFYYVDNMLEGVFPYWDPYMLTGTYFYPNVHIIGVLDPLVLIFIPLIKFFGLSILNAYTAWYLTRLLIFILGAYYLIRHITGHDLSSLIAAGILLLSIAPAAFRQNGLINTVFLTPLALHMLILFLTGKTSRRYLNFFVLIIIVGVTLNIYIPAYFIFNIVLFAVLCMGFRIVSFKNVINLFKSRRSSGFMCIGLLLLLMMAAPAITVFTKDFSKGGELFPSLRIAIQNDAVFKQIKATEVEAHLFSEGFTPRRQFSSYGNLLGFLYPDYAKHFFLRPYDPNHEDDRKRDLYLSESFQYTGLLPLFFVLLGLFYARSRYRAVALLMMVILFINMFSFGGAANQSPHKLQRVFDALFPLLHTIDIRHNFASFFQLYLAVLMALGLKAVLDRETHGDIFKRSRVPSMLLLGILLMKCVVTHAHYNKYFYASQTDLGVMSGLLIGIGAVYGYSRNRVRRPLLLGTMMVLVIFDLAVYNMILKPFVIEKNYLSVLLQRGQSKTISKDSFDYFREPFLITWAPVVTMTESVMKIKGAFSRSYNHTFMMKHFYEYYTHVPMANQFFLSGLARPLIGFFPRDQVDWENSGDILKILSDENMDRFRDRIFLEKDSAHSSTSAGLDLESAVDRPELIRLKVIQNYKRFLKRNQDRLNWLKENLPKHLENENWKIRVTDFNTNEAGFHVVNSTPGYFYYNDGFSRYWKAYDQGQRVPIRRANHNFKAVFLSRGEHDLRFSFEPSHYEKALWLYYLGLLMTALIIGYNIVRESRLLRGF